MWLIAVPIGVVMFAAFVDWCVYRRRVARIVKAFKDRL